MAEPKAAAAPPARWLAAHVFVAALLLYVATSGGSLGTSDAVVTFELTRSLVERGSVALPENVLGQEANRGVDGRYYSQFGIGQSIYNVPFYVAGRTIQSVTGIRMGKTPELELVAAVDRRDFSQQFAFQHRLLVGPHFLFRCHPTRYRVEHRLDPDDGIDTHRRARMDPRVSHAIVD